MWQRGRPIHCTTHFAGGLDRLPEIPNSNWNSDPNLHWSNFASQAGPWHEIISSLNNKAPSKSYRPKLIYCIVRCSTVHHLHHFIVLATCCCKLQSMSSIFASDLLQRDASIWSSPHSSNPMQVITDLYSIVTDFFNSEQNKKYIFLCKHHSHLILLISRTLWSSSIHLFDRDAIIWQRLIWTQGLYCVPRQNLDAKT